ncbi:MAG: isochorismatase family protein [Halieaceae bacterium]|nr:isochorismatase family protein [Halieaceae bacterium]
MSAGDGGDLAANRLGLGQFPALLVVDMTRGFTDPACALGCDCPAVVAVNRALIDQFHALARPVIFTSVVYRGPDQARVFRERLPALNLLTPDSPWIELDPRLGRRPGDLLIEKHWASAFHGTRLNAALRGLGVDSLVVTGLTTSGCVRASAVDGLQYEYRVVVVRDAVADRNQAAHEANLFDLQAKYADVQSSGEVIAALRVLGPAAGG